MWDIRRKPIYCGIQSPTQKLYLKKKTFAFSGHSLTTGWTGWLHVITRIPLSQGIALVMQFLLQTFLRSVVLYHHQRSFFLQHTGTITEIHNWSECRKQQAVKYQTPADTSTLQALDLRLGEHCRRRGGKVVGSRAPGCLLCSDLLYVTGKLHPLNPNSVTALTRFAQQRQWIGQCGWGNCSPTPRWRGTVNYELQGEGESVFSRDNPPDWSSNPK